MNVLDSHIWSEAYDLSVPLQIPIATGQRLICNEVVRAIPGRRYVCRGVYENKTVFIKLFSMTTQAKREYENEQQGIRALSLAGIAAPEILYTEALSESSCQVVVYAALPNAQSARERWENTNQTAQQIVMMQLVELIAQHHAAGLRQTDCHLLNFIYSDDILYTLDAADIVISDSALSRDISMQGLVDLLSLFSVEQDKLLTSLYEQYWQVREGSTDNGELEKLITVVAEKRDYKLRKYLDKTYRDCSAFSVMKSWNKFSTIVREKNNNDMQLLVSSPDAESRSVQRTVIKNGNTCTVSLLEIAEQKIICKRYNIKNSWHALMRAFRISRASRSWRNAHRLMKFAIATPAPIALVENRFGPVRRGAWFFMQHIDGVNAYDTFRDTDKTQQQLIDAVSQFVRLFEKMLQAKLSHGDMKVTNFIFSDNELFVIDLDSMQQHHNDTIFHQAFRQDMARFMRNWSDLPAIATLFEQQLSTSSVAEYLPASIKG